MKVGDYALVPCVKLPRHGKVVWVPILNDHPHADPEFGNDFDHFHIDFRFFSPAFLEWFNKGREVKQGNVAVIRSALARSKVEYKRLRMCRKSVLIRFKHQDCGHIFGKEGEGMDLYAFEESMVEREVVVKGDCRICPHRGVSLDGATKVVPGVVECPGHGLAWNTHTGKLHRRAMPLATCS